MSSLETMPSVEDVKKDILKFCILPRRKEDILQYIGIKVTLSNSRKYITRLFENRYLCYTIPGRPRSSNQQYITSIKGGIYLKALE